MYSEPIVHNVTDASNGTIRQLVIQFDQHGATLSTNGRALIVVDLRGDDFDVYRVEEDGLNEDWPSITIKLPSSAPQRDETKLFASAPDMLAFLEELSKPEHGAVLACTGLGQRLRVVLSQAKGNQ